MGEPQDIIVYEEPGLGSKLMKQAERNPFLIVGIAGFLGALGVGAYNFKNRSRKVPMSLFFIQLRVVAQSIVIGSLTVGMTWGMIQQYILKNESKGNKSMHRN